MEPHQQLNRTSTLKSLKDLTKSLLGIFIMMLFCFQANSQTNSNDCVDIVSTCTSGALRLDGHDDRVVLPNQITLGNSFTLEYWVRHNGSDNTFDRITSSGPTALFETAKNGSGRLAMHGLGRGWRTTTVTISSTDYDHIAWVFDGSTVRLYQNGVEEWSDTGHSPDTRLGDWSIGSFIDGANVSIDEVRLWDSVRTAQQINDNASPCGVFDTQGLVFGFSFDEGTGTTATEIVSSDAITIQGGAANWQNDNVQTEITTDEDPPTVVTQNIPVSLGADGTVTISAAQLDGGSNDNAGAENLIFSVDGASEVAFNCDDLESTCTSGTLRLDGHDDRVVLPNQIALGNSFTLEYWVRHNGSDNTFDRITSSGPTALFETAKNGSGRLAMHGLGRGWRATTVTISSTDYDHIAWVFDGSTVRLYQNGVEEWSDTGHSPDTRLGDWSIGSFIDGANVSIDEVRLWDSVRTAQQINDNASPCGVFDTQGLVFGFSFDEGTGTTAAEIVSGDAITIQGGAANWQNDNVQTTIGVPVTLTVTDACGNAATGRAIVTVEDNLTPTINLNGDATIDLNQNQVYTETATAIDNCSTTTLEISGSVNTAVLGTYVLNYSSSDDNGNTATATRTVNVIDATPPTAVAQNITVQLDANGNATITPDQIDNGSSDNSGDVTLSLDQTTLSCDDLESTCATSSLRFNGGNNRVVLNDQITLGTSFTLEYWVKHNGHDQSFDRITSSRDAIFETAKTASGELTVHGLGRGWRFTGVQVSSTDYDHIAWVFEGNTLRLYQNGVEVYSDSDRVADSRTKDWFIGGTSFPGEFGNFSIDELRLWDSARSIEEINNNASPCAAIDTQGLVFRFSFDEGSGTTVTESVSGDVLDITGSTPVWENDNQQTTTGVPVTLTVEDAAGNTATANAVVTVEDNIAPTVNLNGDGVINLNQNEVYTETATAEDNCAADLEITGTVDTATAGTYVLNYTATDASGNESTAMRTVNVLDVTPPTAVAQNITVQLDANGNATITPDQIDNGSSDNSGDVTLSLDQTTLSCNDLESTCATSSLRFNGGNNRVVLNDQITLGTSFTLEYWVKHNGHDQSFDRITSSRDAIFETAKTASGELTVHGLGRGWRFTGVQVSSTDYDHIAWVFEGNTLRLYQNGVEVYSDSDRVADSRTKDWFIGGTSFPGEFGNFSIDELRLWHSARSIEEINNNASPCAAIDTQGLVFRFSFDEGSGTTVTESVSGDVLDITGSTPVWESDNEQTTSGVPVTLTVEDAAGNTATANAVVTVEDNIAPTVNLNGDAVVQHDAFTPYNDAGATADDNCSAVLATDNPVNVNQLGTYTVTYTATDASGNETVATRTVIVQDVTAPTAVAQDITVQLDANGNATIIPEQIDNGSSDDSGQVTLSLDQTSFDCSDVAQSDNALTFSGALNEYVSVPQSGELDQSNITVEAWLKPRANDGNNRAYLAMRSTTGGGTRWSLHLSRTGGYVGVYNGSTFRTVSKGSAFNVDQWYHVAVVMDNSGSDLYIDGTYIGRISAGINTGVTGRDLTIGDPNGPSTRFAGEQWIGEMDEVRIWNGSRTQQQINGNKDRTLNGNEVSLISYFDFNEGQGNTTSDGSSSGLTGTFTNLDPNTDWVDGALGSGNGASNVVVLTVTDPSGNVSTATAVVTVEDSIAPEISGPADINVFGTSAAGAVVNYATPVGTDNCEVTTELTTGLASGATFPIGTTLVTYTATDDSGNTASASFSVTVTGLPPQIVVPADITVSNDAGECGAMVNFEATDAVGIPASTITYDIQPGTFFPVGTTTITATATNPVGTSSASFTITVIDNQAPTVITQNITVDLDANGNATIIPEQINAGSTDNCTIASITLDKEFFSCADVGDQTVTLTVTDESGNSSAAMSTVTVRDVTAPEFLTRESFIIFLDENGVATVTPDQFNRETVEDNCGVETITFDKTTFNCDERGFHVINITATDASGNTTVGQADVEVRDEIAPTVITQNITVDLDANGNATITPEMVDGGTFDNCAFTLSLNIDSFTCAQVGENVVELTAHDQNGVFASANATVTVRDVTAPEFLTRESFIIFLDENGVATVTPDQFNRETVEDNCGIETITFDKTTFNCDERGFHVINITATDASGNTTVGQADVEVRDEIAPTVITQNITVDLDANGNATITPEMVDGGTFDNCAFTLSLNIDSFTCAQVGENVVELTAHDQNGVFASANATVTVRDVTAPEFLTRESFIIFLDENGVATVTPDQFNRETIEDNCVVETITFDKTTFNCDERGFHVINITATDASGNTTVGQADVEVRDEIAPTVITQNITVDLDANGNATITPEMVDGGTFDNCAFTLSLNIDSFTCAQVGENVVELTAHDQNGVFASANATVTVRDVTAPEFLTRESFIIFLDENGVATVTPDQFNRETVEDNCGIETITFDKTTFNCDERGFHVINITATDASGNTTVGQADVEVRDEIAPTVITQNITVDLDANGNATITPEMVDGGTFDNCAFTLSLNIDSFTCAQVGENVVELTAHDQNGVFASANATVTVRDVTGPAITANDAEVFLDAFGNASISLADLGASVTDPCGSGDIITDNTSFDCSNLGANTVTLTATDANGNTTTTTVTVTVTDNIAPTVITQNITVDLDANGNASITPEDVLILDASDVVTGEDCTVSAAEEHAVWLSNYVQSTNTEASHRWGWSWKWKPRKKRVKSKNTRFVFTTGGGNLHKNEDGTATVTGNIVSTTDPTDSWTVTLNLKDGRNWQEWSALGRSYKDEKGLAGNKYLDWTYYEMAEGSMLTGTGRNQGDEVMLSHAPSNYRYGFQIGEAANSKNANFGMSGWFFYKNRAGKWVQGDFNLDVTDCNPSLPPTGTVVTDDNCSLDTFTLSQSSFDCSDLGDNIVNVTVTDQSGNATTVPVTVTISDPTGPTAVAKDITVSLGANGTVTINPQDVDGGSTDNCGIVSYSLSRDTFDCDDVNGRGWGYYKKHKKGKKVTLTVTDAAGNTDSATAYVTVVDDQAPEISSEPITVVVYGRRRAYLSSRDVYPAVTDNCGVRYISFARKRFTRRDVGINSVWVSAVDYSGNRITGMLNVNVVDISKYGRWVEICYNGRSWRVYRSHVQHWLRKGASLGSCSTSNISQASEFTYGEEESTTKESDILELDIRPEVKLSTYPNPTSGYTVISFMSEVEGPAKVAVMNTSGVQLATLFDEEVGAGEEVEVGYETNQLTSGIYIVRLVTPAGVKTVKLLVRK